MNKPYFIMMIGLSASGKSSIVKSLSETLDVDTYSSDEMRLELFGNYEDQTHNEDVFRECFKRIKNSLNKGNNVIFDATNVSIKSRRNILVSLENIKCYKIAYVIAKSIEQCQLDNINREHPVPSYVIERQAGNFQIPFKEEGFDYIEFSNYNDILLNKEIVSEEYIETIKEMMKFDQKNNHHINTLGEHCSLCTRLLNGKTKNSALVSFANIHDIGKLYTQSIDEEGQAHYYGHANIGAYHVLVNPKLAIYTSVEEFTDILFYINYHMEVFNWKEPKTHNKYKKLFGVEKYNNLLLFNSYDSMSATLKYFNDGVAKCYTL